MIIWDSWDEEQRQTAVKIAGLFAAVLTVFILLSCISYLFSWQQDMSMLSAGEAAANADEIANAAGSLGFKTGHFLVCRLFGLGSFAIAIVFGAAAVRLLTGKWKQSLVKTCLVSLFGALTASFVLTWFGHMFQLDTLFGGGLGGLCGATVIEWAEVQLGTTVTGLCLLAIVAVFFFLSSRKFSHIMANAGKAKEKKAKTAEEAPVEEESPVSESESEAEPQAAEPEPEPELEQDSAPEPKPEPVVAEGKEEKPVAEDENNFEIVEDEGLDKEVKKELPPINNRLDPPEGLPAFSFPPSLELLHSYADKRTEVSSDELTRNNNKIRTTLANYRIQVSNVKAIVGPTVTLYKVYPAPGVKIAEIRKLQEDIAMSLNAKGVRVVTLSDSVGIEVANDRPSMVPLKSLLNDDNFRNSKAELPIAIGYTITQVVKVFDLADAPHLLIAGATKQGKSVCLNVIVASLLYAKHPSELKFVFIDPKRVEFTAYASLLHHYMAVMPIAGSEEKEEANAIVKQPKDAEKILRSLCEEMDNRYDLLSEAGVNNIKLYNEKYKKRTLNPERGHRFMPYLVVIIDEYADLTMTQGAGPEAKAMGRSITTSVVRLAQKGRAAGLHVILATQRPSVDVISGLIKSNFPMRIAFRTSSRSDSQTILDTPGAEKLIGNGDMIFSPGLENERMQCAYISGDETRDITISIAEQRGYGRSYGDPYYLPEVGDPGAEGGSESSGGMVDMHNLDSYFEEAARMVVTNQRGSTSDLQRKMSVGYARAGKIMDQLQAAGIVGPQDGSKPRQVLVSDLNELESILDAYMHRN